MSTKTESAKLNWRNFHDQTAELLKLLTDGEVAYATEVDEPLMRHEFRYSAKGMSSDAAKRAQQILTDLKITNQIIHLEDDAKRQVSFQIVCSNPATDKVDVTDNTPQKLFDAVVEKKIEDKMRAKREAVAKAVVVHGDETIHAPEVSQAGLREIARKETLDALKEAPDVTHYKPQGISIFDLASDSAELQLSEKQLAEAAAAKARDIETYFTTPIKKAAGAALA